MGELHQNFSHDSWFLDENMTL